MINITAVISLFMAAINASSWKETLPIMAIGMIGIFLVIGVIILFTYALNKIFSGKKKKKEDK